MSTKTAAATSLFDPAIIFPALRDAFIKLDPRQLLRNPVIFVTEVVAVLVTGLWVQELVSGTGSPLFSGQIAIWLWFTVLFATFAEAVAEGRGKAQAESLKRAKSDLFAKRLKFPEDRSRTDHEVIPAASLRIGDIIYVETNDLIPGDGEIIDGVASVNESAITGESAPVIRESGGDRSAVTGGTQVISDWLKIRITTKPGETFVDRMIALIEGAKRQKTPNEIALSILLSGLTLIFLIAVVTLYGLAAYSGTDLSAVVLAALLVTLIPTTIGGLLSAIGIAGMDRLIRFNVIATSGRSVEAAGDVDTLLLDKTGTITYGNRMATEFLPVAGVAERDLAEAVLLASLADETAEGRSIVALAKADFGLSEPSITGKGTTSIPFTAQTRISGIDIEGRQIRKGAIDSVLKFAGLTRDDAPREFLAAVDKVARTGGTPLGVADSGRLLGVVHLKDVVKPGIKERFAALRAMGIKTVMVTGDNPVTAAAIASEAGVDDFIAEATPEQKLDYIRKEQVGGRLIAMCGDGTNDAPALGPGRRWRGHADRHPGRPRGRQHGGSGLQPHQAHRDRRDRQTDPDDAWLADHLLHRQRCGQILRHHPGFVPGDLSPAWRAQHHGPAQPAIGDPVGGYLQCPDHHRIDPAGPARRQIPPRRRRRPAVAQPADLRCRWPHRPLHLHQADRHDHHRDRDHLMSRSYPRRLPPP